jgi:hypothetical protein
MKKWKETESGQAAILLAMAMVGLIAFAALAIDGGNAYFMRRNAQNASDAGAYAGSRELFIMRHRPWQDCTAEGGPTYEGICLLMVINEEAERNGVPDTNGVAFDEVNDNVEAYFVDEDGISFTSPITTASSLTDGDPMGVRVITTIPFDTFIAGIIGRTEMAATTRSAALLNDKTNAANHAIWADADCPNSTVCKISGSYQEIEGGIHSNADLEMLGVGTGDDPALITGTLEWAGEILYHEGQIIFDPADAPDADPVPVYHLPLLFDIDDYDLTKSGARALEAEALGEYYYYPDNGTGTQPQMDMVSGLHFSADADGLDLGADGSIVPLDITVVTAGKVTYHVKAGDVSLLFPYVDGILVFSMEGEQGCPSNITAVSMSVDFAQWEGLIYAPNGHVDMSFSQNSTLRGSIIAWTIDISGSDFRLIYDARYDPDYDPRVTLFE